MTKQFLFCLILIFLFVAGVNAQSKRSRTVQPKNVDIHKINFKTMKYRIDDKSLTQKDLKVLSTKFGDLTGDGNDEAVVHISWSFGRYGGTGYGYWVDIFTVENNKLKVLARLDGGSKSDTFQIKLLEIKDSQLIVKQCEMNQQNYEQFFATIRYEWNGERLIEVERTRVKVEDNCWG